LGEAEGLREGGWKGCGRRCWGKKGTGQRGNGATGSGGRGEEEEEEKRRRRRRRRRRGGAGASEPLSHLLKMEVMEFLIESPELDLGESVASR
jgi:hypothetical protein